MERVRITKEAPLQLARDAMDRADARRLRTRPAGGNVVPIGVAGKSK
jgi:hypothetical protein